MAKDSPTMVIFLKDSPKLKLGNVKRQTRLAARAAIAGWDEHITEIGGIRTPSSPCDHQSGLAIDIMKKDGCNSKDDHARAFRKMCDFFIKYADEYLIQYIIFEQRLWAIYRGHWREYTSGHGCTHGHWNHIHISFNSPSGCTPGSSHTFKTKQDERKRPLPPTTKSAKWQKSYINFLGNDSEGKANFDKDAATASIQQQPMLKVSSMPSGTTTAISMFNGKVGPSLVIPSGDAFGNMLETDTVATIDDIETDGDVEV